MELLLGLREEIWPFLARDRTPASTTCWVSPAVSSATPHQWPALVDVHFNYYLKPIHIKVFRHEKKFVQLGDRTAYHRGWSENSNSRALDLLHISYGKIVIFIYAPVEFLNYTCRKLAFGRNITLVWLFIEWEQLKLHFGCYALRKKPFPNNYIARMANQWKISETLMLFAWIWYSYYIS